MLMEECASKMKCISKSEMERCDMRKLAQALSGVEEKDICGAWECDYSGM
jgi:hypothetical protein